MTMPFWVRRYGGFALVLVVLCTVLVVAPTKSPTQVQTFGGTGEQSAAPGQITDTTDDSVVAADPAEGVDPGAQAATSAPGGARSGPTTGTAARPGSAASAGSTAARPGASNAPSAGSPGQTPGVASASTGDCSRRAILGTDVPCKPEFAGSNGGPGSKGVTDKEITLVWYRDKQNEQVQAIIDSTGAAATAEEQEQGLQRMTSWFNKNFQLYGRKVKLVYVKGQASNKDVPAMRADAQAIDQEQKAFAVLSGTRSDFIDELARRQIISFGNAQFPLSYATARAPFVYGILPDADTTNAHITEYIAKRLGPSSMAQHGGDVSAPQVNGVTRKYGIVFPSIAEYGQAADDLERRLAAAGIKTTAKVGYASDINQAAATAQNVVTQLTAAGVTTVLCVCDPIAPVFFTSASTKQGYYPEWFQTGYLLQDVAALARLYDQTQWAHNFGLSTLPAIRPQEQTPAWKIQQQEVPNQTPPSITGYANLLAVFSAIEQAGPRLDPATFRDGAFRFQLVSRSKFDTTFGYGPKDFGGIDDAQEVWWDAEGTDEADGKTGTYRSVNDGYRYNLGGWPASKPRAFEPGCLGAGSCGGARYG